jgi:hypothetical protein
MDIYLIAYLTFRLLPFLVAAVLAIAPLANYNMRGFVYLVGLILAVAGTSFVGYFVPTTLVTPTNTPSTSCDAFSFTVSIDRGYHRVPLDLAILGSSAGYLIYSMTVNGIVSFNIPTLLFFAVAIFGTIYWIATNSCFTWAACVISAIVSGGLGALWGYIVQHHMPHLQYLYTPSNKQTCYKKNDNTYTCSDTNNNGSIE